jgi:hypothetical protein
MSNATDTHICHQCGQKFVGDAPYTTYDGEGAYCSACADSTLPVDCDICEETFLGWEEYGTRVCNHVIFYEAHHGFYGTGYNSFGNHADRHKEEVYWWLERMTEFREEFPSVLLEVLGDVGEKGRKLPLMIDGYFTAPERLSWTMDDSYNMHRWMDDIENEYEDEYEYAKFGSTRWGRTHPSKTPSQLSGLKSGRRKVRREAQSE